MVGKCTVVYLSCTCQNQSLVITLYSIQSMPKSDFELEQITHKKSNQILILFLLLRENSIYMVQIIWEFELTQFKSTRHFNTGEIGKGIQIFHIWIKHNPPVLACQFVHSSIKGICDD